MKIKLMAGVAAACMLSACNTFATLALSLSNPSEGNNNPNWTLGWLFRANTALEVTSLGVYDSGRNGLTANHAVGIWDTSGNLLVSTVVPAGGGTLENYFRFVSIAPLTLGPGNYVIGARPENESYSPFGSVTATISTAPEITFLEDRYVSSGSLTFPSITSGKVGWFGADFQFTATPVPEPSTYIAGALLLLPLGLEGFRRLKNRKATA